MNKLETILSAVVGSGIALRIIDFFMSKNQRKNAIKKEEIENSSLEHSALDKIVHSLEKRVTDLLQVLVAGKNLLKGMFFSGVDDVTNCLCGRKTICWFRES